jgi:hypothetical protein
MSRAPQAISHHALTQARRAELAGILCTSRGSSADTQCARLLQALRSGPLTSVTAREHLDVLALAARLAELRQRGHSFAGEWVLQVTQHGRLHRVVLHHMVREA